MSRLPDGRPDFDDFWDYDDPEGTSRRFLRQLPVAEAAADREYHVELLTQIARTYSLRRMFDEAHRTLDEAADRLTPDMARGDIRHRLEDGRTRNAAGDRPGALQRFEDAWTRARAAGLDGLAVDAAHMCAIVAPPAQTDRWHDRALDLALHSDDPDARRWQGSLHNNIGWTRHAAGDFEAALHHFRHALTAYEQTGRIDDIRRGRWCVGRALRSLGRLAEALALQRELHAEKAAADLEPDGYVHEEIAECLAALGDHDAARPHFRAAHEQLKNDPHLAASEPGVLERLRRRGEPPTPH